MMQKCSVVIVVMVGLCVGMPVAVQAQGNLITNGGFEVTTLIAGAANAATSNGNGQYSGQMGYNVNATGWTTTGYNFLFGAGVADTTGTNGSSANLKLWGPGGGTGNSAYS